MRWIKRVWRAYWNEVTRTMTEEEKAEMQAFSM
jgi:hypothetical protein